MTDDARARGDLAQALIPDAAYLAMAVRDRDPADIRHRLAGLTRHELEALAVVLAAMVDPDRTLQDALGWITWDEYGRPLQDTPPRDWRTVRQAARDPDTQTSGPDWVAAGRALEGEPVRLRGIDRTAAVELGMRRGRTMPDLAEQLGMSLDAVRRSWERIKARRRAAEDAEQAGEVA